VSRFTVNKKAQTQKAQTQRKRKVESIIIMAEEVDEQGETPVEIDEQETPLFMTRMPSKLNDALEAIAAIIDEEDVPTSSSVHSAPASSNTSRKRRSGFGAAQVALSLSCIAEAETLHLPAKRGRCIGRESQPLLAT
jgi:hypothetical protein